MVSRGAGALLVLIGLAAPAFAIRVSPVCVSSFAVQPSTSVAPAETPVVSTLTWRSAPNAAFRAGERFSYVVRWGVIKGGQATLAVREIETIRGRPAYHILNEARSAGVVSSVYKTKNRSDSWLDTESLLTVRYEKHIKEGRYRVERVVEIDQENHTFKDQFNRLDKGTTDYRDGPVPPLVMDVLGSLYYVRTLPLEVGQTYTMDVHEGKKVWPLVVNVVKNQKVKVPAGTFDCVVVEPLLREPGVFVHKGKKLQVWLTTDARRIPVMMRSEVAIGHVSAELTTYHWAGENEPLQGPQNPPPK